MRYFLLFARIYGIFRNFQNGLSYGIQEANSSIRIVSTKKSSKAKDFEDFPFVFIRVYLDR